jgi:hypothetical protein
MLICGLGVGLYEVELKQNEPWAWALHNANLKPGDPHEASEVDLDWIWYPTLQGSLYSIAWVQSRQAADETYRGAITYNYNADLLFPLASKHECYFATVLFWGSWWQSPSWSCCSEDWRTCPNRWQFTPCMKMHVWTNPVTVHARP